MTNPFEVPDADYTVIRNSQNQHYLRSADVASFLEAVAR
jgi:uncharacterized protein YbdZ (MbtH family)